MHFTDQKPTQPGRYTWRLPESEKPGTYDLNVVLTKARGGGLLITTEEGDDICTVAQSRGGQWAPGWTQVEAASVENNARPSRTVRL